MLPQHRAIPLLVVVVAVAELVVEARPVEVLAARPDAEQVAVLFEVEVATVAYSTVKRVYIILQHGRAVGWKSVDDSHWCSFDGQSPPARNLVVISIDTRTQTLAS